MKYIVILVLMMAFGCHSENAPNTTSTPPNVILIMADDMGYESLAINGSTEYSTPILDDLARKGINFSQCVSQPLCTPSRVKIMTGQYNFRNYEYFTYLNPNQKTFGHLMQDAGYKTCIVGKWQLSGLTYELPGYQDSLRPHEMGFDSYCLWQLNHTRAKGERFADPLLQENGRTLPRDQNAYGPDVVSQHAIDFIDKNHDQPFFVYYPMLLTHDPFVPTPNSPEWQNPDDRYKQDTAFFADMVNYTDVIVGRILDKLKQHNLEKNTIVIFTGDNGSHPSIVSSTTSKQIRGAKGNTIEHGIHVPLIVSWPDQIKAPREYAGLVGFADFYATLLDLIGASEDTDGRSLLPLLKGQELEHRENLFVHYDPRWGKRVNAFTNQFVLTEEYKLYRDGGFFNIKEDALEENPLLELSAAEAAIKQELEKELASFPELAVD